MHSRRPAEFPQCDVSTFLDHHQQQQQQQQHGAGGVTNDGVLPGGGYYPQVAYCTDSDLVIWSNAIPNHDVYLEEIPKPPGSGLPEGDFPILPDVSF